MRIALIFIALTLAACSHNWLYPYKMEIRQGNSISPEMRARIRLGMTQNQVKAALGVPLLNDPFHAGRWDYVYRFEKRHELVEDQRLTLYFEGERLVRIDDALTPSAPAVPAADLAAASAPAAATAIKP